MENENQTLLMSVLGLQHTFFRSIHAQLHETNVHPRQGPILSLLLRHEGFSQADLTREMNVSAATVAVSVSRLEKLGFVTRVRNQNNQRANILALTPSGRQEALRLQDIMQQAMQAAVQGFTDEEIKEMAGFFLRMQENLHKQFGIKERNKNHAPNV